MSLTTTKRKGGNIRWGNGEDKGEGLVMGMGKIRGGAVYGNVEDKGEGVVMGMGKIR